MPSKKLTKMAIKVKGNQIIDNSENINISGICTALRYHGDGSQLEGISAGIGPDDDINTTGTVTASSFRGDGSQLDGVAASIPYQIHISPNDPSNALGSDNDLWIKYEA